MSTRKQLKLFQKQAKSLNLIIYIYLNSYLEAVYQSYLEADLRKKALIQKNVEFSLVLADNNSSNYEGKSKQFNQYDVEKY